MTEAPDLACPAPARGAARSAVDLDAATDAIVSAARTRRRRVTLGAAPVVVTGGGGAAVHLVRAGGAVEHAELLPPAHRLATAVGRSHGGLRALAASAADPRDETPWWPTADRYLERHRAAAAALEGTPMTPEHRTTLAAVLVRNREILAGGLLHDAGCVDLIDEWDAARACAEVAEAIEVEHWLHVLGGWRVALGAEWQGVRALCAVDPAARRPDVRTTVVAQVMGRVAVAERLLFVSDPWGDASVDDLLTRLTPRRGARPVTDYVHLDVADLGEPARRALVHGAARLGLPLLAPDLVPVLAPATDTPV